MESLVQAATTIYDKFHTRELKPLGQSKRFSPLEACAEEIIQCLRLLSKQEDRARRELQLLRSGVTEHKKSSVVITIVDLLKTRYLFAEPISVKLRVWSEEAEHPQAPYQIVPILQHQSKSQMTSDAWNRVPLRTEGVDLRQEVPHMPRGSHVALNLTALVQNSNLPSQPSWFRFVFELQKAHVTLSSCATHRFEIAQDPSSAGGPKDLWDISPAADIARVPGLTLQYAARFRARGIYNVSDLAAITPEAAATMFEAIKQNGPLQETEFTKWIQQARSATKREQQVGEADVQNKPPAQTFTPPNPAVSPAGSSTESEKDESHQEGEPISPAPLTIPPNPSVPEPEVQPVAAAPAPPQSNVEARLREVSIFLAEIHQQIERLTRVQSWVCQSLLEQRSSSMETMTPRKLAAEPATLQTMPGMFSSTPGKNVLASDQAPEKSRILFAPIIPNEPPPPREEPITKLEPDASETSSSPAICCVCKSIEPENLNTCATCDRRFHAKCLSNENSQTCPSCEVAVVDTIPSEDKPESSSSAAETPLDRLTKLLSNPNIPIAGQAAPLLKKREHGSEDLGANKRMRMDGAVVKEEEWRPVCELRTRGLRTREKYFQSKPIVFDVMIDVLDPSVMHKTMRVVLHLVDGFDLLCDQDLKGDTSYPVGKELFCNVSNLAVNSLSSKKGGHFRFRIELLGRDPGGAEELLGQGITTPFQVQTKRLIFRPKLTDLIPDHSIRLLPKIGPTYGQKMEEKFQIVTIADMALKLTEADAERVCAVVRRERGVLKPDDVRRAISLAKQIVAKNGDVPTQPQPQPQPLVVTQPEGVV